MAFDIASIDGSINAGRESVLGWINRVPDSTQLKLGFLVFAAVMAIILMRQFSQGQEERKGMYGTLAIVILCFSILFGFRVMLVAWIVILLLGLELAKKLKQADSKGAGMIVIVMCVLAYVLSVNILMMITIVGGVLALGWAAKRANFHKIYGDSGAAREAEGMGVPMSQERRLLRALGRIAKKGGRWGMDKMTKGMALLKQRFAESALKNEAEQIREAEIVAAGEDISKNLYTEEEELEKLEEADTALIQKILEQCAQLEEHLISLPVGEIATEGKERISKAAHEILRDSHTLVKNKLSEETILEKANRLFQRCMEIIHHSADQLVELSDHQKSFDKEIRSTAKKNIVRLRAAVREEEAELHKAEAQATGNAKSLVEQRKKGLEEVASKLASVEHYLLRIEALLQGIDAREKQKIAEIVVMAKKAKEHSKMLHEYSARFRKNAKKLEARYGQFKHIFEAEGKTIADTQLITVKENTILMFDNLNQLSRISEEYHAKELLPLMQELATVASDAARLSKTSEYLSKLYFRMAQANEELTQIAARLDKDPKAKNKLEAIWKQEQFEEKVIKRGYRIGRGVLAHVQQGYSYLQQAYKQTGEHVRVLQGYIKLVEVAKGKVSSALTKAIDKMLGKEIKEVQEEAKEAGKAQGELAKGFRAERVAAHAR